MNEFLSYELFGLITMKTYLIVAFGCLIIDVAFSKKPKSSLKYIVDALIWPWTVILLCVALALCAVVGLITIMSKK